MPNRKNTIITLDFETTGININTPDPSIGEWPVSIGLTKYENGKKIAELYHIINPIDPKGHIYQVTPGAKEVHGFSNEYLKDHGVLFSEIKEEVRDFIGEDSLVVAHHVPFDIPFYNSMARDNGIPPIPWERVIDTKLLAACHLPDSDTDLDSLAHEFHLTPRQGKIHSALEDSELTGALYFKLKDVSQIKEHLFSDIIEKNLQRSRAIKDAHVQDTFVYLEFDPDEEIEAIPLLDFLSRNDIIWEKTDNHHLKLKLPETAYNFRHILHIINKYEKSPVLIKEIEETERLSEHKSPTESALRKIFGIKLMQKMEQVFASELMPGTSTHIQEIRKKFQDAGILSITSAGSNWFYEVGLGELRSVHDMDFVLDGNKTYDPAIAQELTLELMDALVEDFKEDTQHIKEVDYIDSDCKNDPLDEWREIVERVGLQRLFWRISFTKQQIESALDNPEEYQLSASDISALKALGEPEKVCVQVDMKSKSQSSWLLPQNKRGEYVDINTSDTLQGYLYSHPATVLPALMTASVAEYRNTQPNKIANDLLSIYALTREDTPPPTFVDRILKKRHVKYISKKDPLLKFLLVALIPGLPDMKGPSGTLLHLIDPEKKENVDKVKEGLLANVSTGNLDIFDSKEAVDIENEAETLAKKLLDNAWEVFEQTLSVKRERNGYIINYTPAEKEYLDSIYDSQKDVQRVRERAADLVDNEPVIVSADHVPESCHDAINAPNLFIRSIKAKSRRKKDGISWTDIVDETSHIPWLNKSLRRLFQDQADAIKAESIDIVPEDIEDRITLTLLEEAPALQIHKVSKALDAVAQTSR